MVMVEMGALDKHLGKGLSRVTHWIIANKSLGPFSEGGDLIHNSD